MNKKERLEQLLSELPSLDEEDLEKIMDKISEKNKQRNC